MSEKKITMIIAGEPASEMEYVDREGGETQKLGDFFRRLFGKKEFDFDDVSEKLSKIIDKVEDMLDDVKPKIKNKKWRMDSVSVGLAITAEGSIGVATAGVQTSIEVTFSPKR